MRLEFVSFTPVDIEHQSKLDSCKSGDTAGKT
jgi:hypothetical protein